MRVKQITCREHGGTFTIPAVRGRPPVRCNPQNLCSAAASARKGGAAQARRDPAKATAAVGRVMTNAAKQVATRSERPVRQAQPVAAESNGADPTLTMAKATAKLLERKGWSVKGRAKDGTAHVTATRDDEMITMTFQGGKCTQQDYSLWAANPGAGYAGVKQTLKFDPSDISDAELARTLNGCKVAWHNRLSGGTEIAVISNGSIHIENQFAANGDSNPLARVIKFVCPTSGYRAFRLDALMKVGRSA